MKKTGNYCMCSLGVLITNGKRISINWADCAFTLYLQNSLGSSLDDKCMVILNNIITNCCPIVTLQPHSQASPVFTFICVHNNTRMWSSTHCCVLLWALTEGKKGGGLGTRLVTLYIQASVFVPCCCSILFLPINDLWPKELSSLQIWSVELAGLDVVMKSVCLLYIKFVIHVNITKVDTTIPKQCCQHCVMHIYAHILNMFLHCMYTQMYAALLT